MNNPFDPSRNHGPLAPTLTTIDYNIVFANYTNLRRRPWAFLGTVGTRCRGGFQYTFQNAGHDFRLFWGTKDPDLGEGFDIVANNFFLPRGFALIGLGATDVEHNHLWLRLIPLPLGEESNLSKVWGSG